MTAAKRAWDVLAQVPDPELPAVSVVDLGIVREVEESPDGRRVVVTVTPTYSGCPATEAIRSDIAAALAATYDAVEVRTRLSPPWTTEWVSARGRARLSSAGISPPPGRQPLPLLVEDRPHACPRCGSRELEQLAGFGATPCLALWRCTACREPFDHMKAH